MKPFMREVESFAVACERLMFARTHTPLSEEDRRLILYYLSEVAHNLEEVHPSTPLAGSGARGTR